MGGKIEGLNWGEVGGLSMNKRKKTGERGH